MTQARPLGIALISALFGGIGTYELLRNGSGMFQKAIIVPQDEPLYDEEDKSPVDIQKTYLEIFKEENLNVVDGTTTVEQLGNVVLGRMFPNYRKEHKQSANQMFTGSPEITLTGSIRKNNAGKEMFVMAKNTKQDLDNWKQACIEALNKKPDNPNDHSQKYRLKEWCTVSTVRKVLLRHKFKIPSTNEQWKKILESKWITDDRYKDKQSFLSNDDLTKLRAATSDDKSKISILKQKCDTALDKPFERTNFPATTDFLGSGNKADEFQEAALLCTVPTTAEKYVQEAMKGTTHGALPPDISNDYCYDAGKKIDDYKQIKTTDPMEGKSFWCAVRVIYHKNESRSSRSR